MTSISATLLAKQELPGAFRLEFYNKNDRVIAKLYQGNVKRGMHNLEGVSVKQWEYELSTGTIQDKIKWFLKSHHVPVEEENIVERDTRIALPTPEQVPFESKRGAVQDFPELELPVSFSLVTSSAPGVPFPSLTALNLAQSNTSQVDALFQQILTLEGISSLRQSLLPTLGSSQLEIRDSRGYNLLLAAVTLGNQAIFNAIFPLYKNRDALYATDPYERNALHLASALGHAVFIPLLIEEGFEPDIKDQHGLMPLHWALHEGRVEAIQALIDSGASLVEPWMAPDGHKHYPLELAIVAGDLAALNLLLTSDRFK